MSDLVKRLEDEAKRLWPHPDFNEKGERLGYHPTAVLHEKAAERIKHLEGLHRLGWAARDCPACGSQIAMAAEISLKERIEQLEGELAEAHDHYQPQIDEGIKEHNELRRELAAKQAHTDRLMLEFCPEEMTEEQTAEWASHQRAAPAAPEEDK